MVRQVTGRPVTGREPSEAGEVQIVSTSVYAPPASAFDAAFDAEVHVQASAWRVSGQSTRMPMTAGRLRSIAPSNVRTCAANAARDAATKTAVGGQAFEDPV
jgi:hypothetical protein